MSKIAKDLKIPRATVQSILKPKVKSGRKAGRRPKLNERALRGIKRDLISTLQNNRRVTARSLLEVNNLNVSLKTMHCNLKKFPQRGSQSRRKLS